MTITSGYRLSYNSPKAEIITENNNDDDETTSVLLSVRIFRLSFDYFQNPQMWFDRPPPVQWRFQYAKTNQAYD